MRINKLRQLKVLLLLGMLIGVVGCTAEPQPSMSHASNVTVSSMIATSSSQSSTRSSLSSRSSQVQMVSSSSAAISSMTAMPNSSSNSLVRSSSSQAASSVMIMVDECDTTAQCRDLFGQSASDCKDSLSDFSVCMCGNSACRDSESSMSESVLSSSSAAPSNGGASWGQDGIIGPRTNFPCTGCLFDTPNNYSHDTPTPLLITFHGDEGYPGSIHKVYNEQPGFGKKAGFIVASLKCPKALKCDQTGSVAPGAVKANYSWWLWQRFIPEYDPNWINRQVDKIEQQYNIDLSRIYFAGFSGGTTYLSTWGIDHSDRYAGMILSAGGGLKEVETKSCNQNCPLAIVISTGLDDFLHSNAVASRDFAERCGHEVLYRETAGKGHTFIGKDISEGLQWLLARPHQCLNSP